MKIRGNIPKDVLERVLVKSKRRCPLCLLAGDEQPKTGNIAHIVPARRGGREAFDNLVFLCQEHHAAMDSAHTPYTPNEIRALRDELYEKIGTETNIKIIEPSRPAVFVVHGYDEAAKGEVQSFLEDSGVASIVLSEQPSMGWTVLEKIQSYSGVDYAIVVLTPDEANGKPRENMIFELGYLMGRFGSQRVCALYKPPVKIPSDFHGVLYIEMDRQGNWRRMLRNELMHAGLSLGKGKAKQKTGCPTTASSRRQGRRR